MYGLIGKMRAVAGQRDALIAILLEGTGSMPGCLSYIVATDPADADAIWITEVWDSEASHKASLQLPAVRDAIARGPAADRGVRFPHRHHARGRIWPGFRWLSRIVTGFSCE